MQALTLIPSPEPAATRFARAWRDHWLVRAANLPLALGLVLLLLARSEPFSRAPLGLRGTAAVAYVGWAARTMEQALRGASPTAGTLMKKASAAFLQALRGALTSHERALDAGAVAPDLPS